LICHGHDLPWIIQVTANTLKTHRKSGSGSSKPNRTSYAGLLLGKTNAAGRPEIPNRFDTNTRINTAEAETKILKGTFLNNVNKREMK